MTKGGPEAVEPVVYLPSFSVGVILAYFIIRYLKTLHLRQNIAISRTVLESADFRDRYRKGGMRGEAARLRCRRDGLEWEYIRSRKLLKYELREPNVPQSPNPTPC